MLKECWRYAEVVAQKPQKCSGLSARPSDVIWMTRAFAERNIRPEPGQATLIVSSSSNGYKLCLACWPRFAHILVRTESVAPMASDWSRACKTGTQTAQP